MFCLVDTPKRRLSLARLWCLASLSTGEIRHRRPTAWSEKIWTRSLDGKSVDADWFGDLAERVLVDPILVCSLGVALAGGEEGRRRRDRVEATVHEGGGPVRHVVVVEEVVGGGVMAGEGMELAVADVRPIEVYPSAPSKQTTGSVIVARTEAGEVGGMTAAAPLVVVRFVTSLVAPEDAEQRATAGLGRHYRGVLRVVAFERLDRTVGRVDGVHGAL